MGPNSGETNESFCLSDIVLSNETATNVLKATIKIINGAWFFHEKVS